MRRIDKRPERPPLDCLAQARRDRDAAGTPPSPKDWSLVTTDCKQLLRGALREDQRGLCCYCTGRVGVDAHTARIEHWAARSVDPGACLDWANLLLACSGAGGVRAGEVVETCDRHRADRALHHHPARPAPPVDAAFRLNRGTAKLVGTTPEAERDIETLNLNADHLVAARRSALDAVRATLERKEGAGVARRLLHQMDGSQSGDLPPFAPLVAQYLRGKVEQRSG